MRESFDSVKATAKDLGFDNHGVNEICSFVTSLQQTPGFQSTLSQLADELKTDEGFQVSKFEELEIQFGRRLARNAYLLLALTQVPDALERRGRIGIPDEINRRTLADITLWANHFRVYGYEASLNLEILEWAQNYLKGNLSRIGPLHCDLINFNPQIQIAKLPTAGDQAVSLYRGQPVLKIHFPADATWDFKIFIEAVAKGWELFGKLNPPNPAVGICGEAWLFDAKILPLLHNPMLNRITELCHFYPSRIPEERTIHRIFGPDVKRSDLQSMDAAKMTSLQAAMAGILSDPQNSLTARGGFISRETIEKLPEFSGALRI